MELLCATASEIGLSILCYPEVLSGLCRLVRQGDLNPERYEFLKQRLGEDCGSATSMDLTPAIVRDSCRLLELNTLRAADALHVATALYWKAEGFVTSDVRQMQAADKENLHVIPV